MGQSANKSLLTSTDRGEAVDGDPRPEPASFTPGPWRVWQNALWIMADNVPKGPMHVADVRGWGYLTGKGHALALPNDQAFAIQKANAHLIASAPDLFAALEGAEQAIVHLNGEVACEETLLAIRRALSLARGEK